MNILFKSTESISSPWIWAGPGTCFDQQNVLKVILGKFWDVVGVGGDGRGRRAKLSLTWLSWEAALSLPYHLGNHQAYRGLPQCLSGKELTCQCRRRGFNLWVGKIPWRRKWQLTPVLLLGNPMDRGAWWATVHGIKKELDATQWPNEHAVYGILVPWPGDRTHASWSMES